MDKIFFFGLICWALIAWDMHLAKRIAARKSELQKLKDQECMLIERNYRFIKSQIEKANRPEHFETLERLIDERLRRLEAHALAFELANLIQVKKVELIGNIYPITE